MEAAQTTAASNGVPDGRASSPPAQASDGAAAAPRRSSAVPARPSCASAKDVAGARTLAVDIGGTGVKASVLDAAGSLTADRVRVPTPYPCPPDVLVGTIVELARRLPEYDRVSVGFPGMVRGGRILSAPHFVTVAGPGTRVDDRLLEAWRDVDLAQTLRKRLGRPTRVLNDADLQGAAVISGRGLELVITLGTGLGTALYHDGRLAPHLELSHHPFRKGQTYDEQLGNATLERIGRKRWRGRVLLAIETLDRLLYFDHLYVGGGNARHVGADLGPRATVVDNLAGILGGIKLWERRRL